MRPLEMPFSFAYRDGVVHVQKEEEGWFYGRTEGCWGRKDGPFVAPAKAVRSWLQKSELSSLTSSEG